MASVAQSLFSKSIRSTTLMSFLRGRRPPISQAALKSPDRFGAPALGVP